MDLLTELLDEAGLVRRIFDRRRVSTEHAIRFPCDRSVGFHVVLDGVVYLHSAALAEPLRLETGDIAVMGRGCVHLLSTSSEPDTLPIIDVPMDGAGPPTEPTRSPDAVSVVSGAYQLWHTPLHPFFSELPEWFVLRTADAHSDAQAGAGNDVRATLSLLADESQRDALGRQTVVHALLDVLFTYLMREMVSRRGTLGAGWSHALRDPHVHQALQELHADPSRPWTLESIAHAVGLSRSVLAERFRDAMGDTPLSYLRTVRMQRAMRLLVESDHTLEQVAAAVGYQDAFGFSKAFKRAVGSSPGEYRRRDAAERTVPWRFRPNASAHVHAHPLVARGVAQ